MRKRLTVIACCFALPAFFALPAVAADCVGHNLIDRLPAPQQAALQAAVTDLPYRRGLFWQAQKDGMRITLIGTYHFADPRHDLTLQAVAPYLDRASALLVEAGPAEMQQLTDHMQSDPGLLTVTEGPALPDRLSAAQWAEVSAVLAARGIPDFIARKMTPWYAAMMMGLSPCMLASAAEPNEGGGGLDQMLIARAQQRALPIQALEPWDTLFRIFADLTPEEEIELILSSLPAAQYADDYAQTLIDAYFDADVWTVWEFGRIDAYENSGLSRQQVDAQIALGQERMIDARNKNWIGPLTLAAQNSVVKSAGKAGREGEGHIVAGFGALHLPGPSGVLNLLAQEGWMITPLPLPDYTQATAAAEAGRID